MRPGWTRWAAAIAMGFCSGMLVSYIAELLGSDVAWAADPGVPERPLSVWLTWPLMLAAWGLSAWLLQRRTGGAAEVLRRGFVLGVVEWVAFAIAGVMFAGRVIALGEANGSDATGPLLGGGYVGFVTVLIGGVMAAVCIAGYALVHWWTRREPPPLFKKCPDCAELVRAEALKCRFCGFRFSTGEAPPASA